MVRTIHFDSLFDREPVEVLEEWCDVVSGAGAGEQAGSGVLYVLEFIDNVSGDAIDKLQ